MMNYLVPIDFSNATEGLLTFLETLASKKDEITLLHAAELNPALVGFEAGPDVVRAQIAEEFKKEHKEIQALSKSLRDKGYNCKGLLIQGRPVKTILERAKKTKADMIVMGSHGRSAAYQILVGSISEGVLHKSTIPVLFVPPKR
ncbi:MAG: universal stress protein [Sphingomonadales bacterium]